MGGLKEDAIQNNRKSHTYLLTYMYAKNTILIIKYYFEKGKFFLLIKLNLSWGSAEQLHKT